MAKLTVSVRIEESDKKVAAMVKALAFDVGGPDSVTGATNQILRAKGHLEFRFLTSAKVDEFRASISRYLPGAFASVI